MSAGLWGRAKWLTGGASSTSQGSLKVIINTKEDGRTFFGGGGYVYDTDCGDGFTGVYLLPNSLSWRR